MCYFICSLGFNWRASYISSRLTWAAFAAVVVAAGEQATTSHSVHVVKMFVKDKKSLDNIHMPSLAA